MLLDLIPAPYRLAVAVAGAALLAAAAFGAGWTVNGWRGAAAVAELRADQAETIGKAKRAERDALADVLAQERALRADLEEIVHAFRQQTADADHRVAGLAEQHQRLRDQLARRPAACARAPAAGAAPADGSAAGAAAGLVPGDWRDVMLDEAATALRALAPAVDDARARHAVCTAAYNAARERLRRYAEQGRAVAP